jgi:hypothetical protein
LHPDLNSCGKIIKTQLYPAVSQHLLVHILESTGMENYTLCVSPIEQHRPAMGIALSVNTGQVEHWIGGHTGNHFYLIHRSSL